MAKPSTSKTRKRVKKNVSEGVAHVHASFNNTIITITDRQGLRVDARHRHVRAKAKHHQRADHEQQSASI